VHGGFHKIPTAWRGYQALKPHREGSHKLRTVRNFATLLAGFLLLSLTELLGCHFYVRHFPVMRKAP